MSRDPEDGDTGASSLVWADIMQLKVETERALPRTTDAVTRMHLQDLAYRIRNATADKSTI